MKQVINRGNRSKTMRTVYQKKKKKKFNLPLKRALCLITVFSHITNKITVAHVSVAHMHLLAFDDYIKF